MLSLRFKIITRVNDSLFHYELLSILDIDALLGILYLLASKVVDIGIANSLTVDSVDGSSLTVDEDGKTGIVITTFF